MENKFVEKESYLHLSAKKIVSDYLKKENLCDYVFEEFKICENDKRGLFEQDDAYFKIMISDYENNTISQERGKIVFVPDVFVIFYQLPIFYEIVYKNDISEKKKKKMELFFKDNCAEIKTIDAERLLNHSTDNKFYLHDYTKDFKIKKYATKNILETKDFITKVYIQQSPFHYKNIVNIDLEFGYFTTKILSLLTDIGDTNDNDIFNIILQIQGNTEISQFLASLEFIIEQIKKSNIELETINDKIEKEEVSMFDFKNTFNL